MQYEKNSMIKMGAYPQNNESLEKEPIEWVILKQEEHRVLCISKYLLDCKPYHEILENVTWEKCTLRKWLNHDFFFAAFSEEEQEKILISNVKNPAKDTQDSIFLLSYDEASKYFEFEERATKTTAYARLQGAWFVDEDERVCEHGKNGSWWLRYLGQDYEKAEGEWNVISCVNFDGYIESAADEVTGTTCCIRPAFWLKVE